MIESRKRLFFLFGLLVAFQWFVFAVMVGLESLSTSSPSTTSSSAARDLRTNKQQQSSPIMTTHWVVNYSENRTAMIHGCFSSTCLEQVAQELSRVFPSRAKDSSWCITSGRRKDPQDKWQGLILVKVPKVASSTAAGVSLRIINRSELTREKPCKTLQWRHHPGAFYTNRSRSKSFLWTTVRDPAERALSTIFFHNISRRRPAQQSNVPDEEMIDLLQHSVDEHSGATSQGQGGFQLRYTALKDVAPFEFYNTSRPRRIRHPTALHNLVQETLQNYDFIAVTDRMEESLVAMALLLGVPVADVLVSSSKVAGQHYQLVHLPHHEFKCLPTVPSYVHPRVKRFLASDTYRAANWGDYLLHQAASISLDRTIDAIGPERFGRALAEYRRLRAAEQQECAAKVQFPCSDTGVPQPDISKQSCYLPFFDFGCGYQCIDAMIDRQQKPFEEEEDEEVIA